VLTCPLVRKTTVEVLRFQVAVFQKGALGHDVPHVTRALFWGSKFSSSIKNK
jgi:hypothetical protein